MPLLSTRFIQKEIESTGNTCTLIEVSRSIATDEYRIVTEVLTNHTSIKCFVNILDESDDSVRQGEAKAGDLIFWFDSDQESYCVNGNRITFDSKTYQINEVRKFDAIGNTTYIIECRTSQI